MPSVSVAMATYNGERFIRRQLDSIARQRLLPAEVVITDDCSSDETVRAVEEFAGRAPFPVHLRKNPTRLGYRGNFMRAASLCGSDLIAFCDQDDEWDVGKLESCVASFDDPDVLLCYHNAVVVDEGDRLVGDLDRYGSPHEVFSARHCQDFWFNARGLTQVVRARLTQFSDLRSLTSDHRSTAGEPLAHDQWFFFLAMSLGRIRYIPGYLVKYRQHEQNVVGFQHFAVLRSNWLRALNTGFEEYDRIESDAIRRAGVLREISARTDGSERERALTATEAYRRLAAIYGKRKEVFAGGLPQRMRALGDLLSFGAYFGPRCSFGFRSLAKDIVYGIVLGSLTKSRRMSGIDACVSTPTSDGGVLGMNSAAPALRDWPSSQKQVLGRCPACGHSARRLLLEGLSDVVFGAAPGQWSVWSCHGCGAAYLDPRPDEQSIGRAYARYYTHTPDNVFASPLRMHGSGWRRAAQRLRNGYLTAKYGHALDGWARLGWLFSAIAPGPARDAEHLIRHLPSAGGSERLLDVGCGNGEWLATARLLGYRAFGLEPDEAASAAAAANGYEVRCGVVPGSGYPDEAFDQITLNHVFEHLHWPTEALNELHRVLKPGGRLWISMPNLSSQGFRLFERHWRGLEVPRHLCLYDPPAIQRLLEACGFRKVELLSPADSAEFYFRQSVAIQCGRNPYAAGENPQWTSAWRRKARGADARSRNDPSLGESLTVIGFKNG